VKRCVWAGVFLYIFVSFDLVAAGLSVSTFSFQSGSTRQAGQRGSGIGISSQSLGVTGLHISDISFASWSDPVPSANSVLQVIALPSATHVLAPALIGRVLNFPNPFSFSADGKTEIGYRLSADMDIEIRIYNLVGQEMANWRIPAGEEGGDDRYNKVTIDRATFNGRALSAGVYYYVLIYQGQILGKGKMMVVP